MCEAPQRWGAFFCYIVLFAKENRLLLTYCCKFAAFGCKFEAY